MTEEIKKAKLKALHILTRMDKSEADLRAGLVRAGFSAQSVQEAIEYVKSYGYIDDERYAFNYVSYHKQRKSRQKIRYELLNKGVKPELIDLAIEACEDFDELELIRKSLLKKWKKEERPDQKELARLFGYLSRQGFSSNDIWHVLKEENLT